MSIPGGTGKRIPENVVDEWVELHKEGLTAKEIAGKYGVGYTTVYRRLTDRGIEISDR